MNRLSLLLLFLLVVLLGSAGAFLYFNRPQPSGIVLSLDGTPGMKVEGTYCVDGVEHQFSGVLPAKLEVSGIDFSYSIWMLQEKGELEGRLLSESADGSVSTDAPFGGIAGEIKGRAHWLFGGQSMMMTSLSKK
ncbi:MAG: hypothetical protein L0Y72_15030 [Gemmataceae bacterium]|nr:hypothetical protein [Gemmataceae bacterium]MCI0740357.1 hypothetical protein [Gemmataceae bacterium]